MRKVILALVVLVTLGVNAQEKWTVDASHSSINFAVSHLVISETTGSFDGFDISATSKENFESPVFSVTIKTASINTKNEGRDKHLRADDFFDAATYPSIQFVQKDFKKLDGKKMEISGDLTIKGITKPVVLKGKINGVVATKYGMKAGVKLETTIKRTDFNVGGEGGSIGEEVELVINLELNKKKA
ncbi:YceI family protein [uncultured Tenacibaculum sp.]|uniref:YceI family protein n=1 Tax=uncultured Tenacibaculum sp. TaxID=174713 RepID=UPI00260479E0|nr:YceI family protein [uncultured Tenacibaculum sp.]